MKSLDTNTLLRLVLGDIPKQTAIVETLLADTSQRFAIADMVFAEMVWVLQGGSYSYDRERIAMNIRSILAVGHINCNRAMLEKAVTLYVSHPKISFIDACLSVYAELSNAKPLLTFDKRFASALPKTVTSL